MRSFLSFRVFRSDINQIPVSELHKFEFSGGNWYDFYSEN